MKTELPKLEDAKITPTHHNQNSSQVLSGFRSTMGILSCIAVMFLSAISALFAEGDDYCYGRLLLSLIRSRKVGRKWKRERNQVPVCGFQWGVGLMA